MWGGDHRENGYLNGKRVWTCLRRLKIRKGESFAPSRRRDVQVGAQEGPALARHVLHRARRSARHDVHHELAAEIVGALGKISVSDTRQGGGVIVLFYKL